MVQKNSTINETFTLAWNNHKKNNLEVAEKLYKKILKTNPNHFQSIYLFGNRLVKKIN